jgi:hypothetical protein
LAVKDTLKQSIFNWKDTGENISYGKLLNVLETNEPLSNEKACKCILHYQMTLEL